MELLQDTYWTVAGWLKAPIVLACVIVFGSIVAAYLTEFLIRKTASAVVAKTTTSLDDTLVAALRRPVLATVVLVGCSWAADVLLDGDGLEVTLSLMETIAVAVWAMAGLRVGSALLEAMSGGRGVVQPSTLAAFEMLMKVAVVGAAVYFTFLAWEIDVTAWLASAGIVGIALGFAAKDTLANLFAGIFILADAPYKIGDWIDLDNGIRGKVTRIGMRSTRILTRNDVEVTMPNAAISSGKIENETGGPYIQQRVAVSVTTAYACDIDKVQEVLGTCPAGIDGVVDHPPPEIRLHAFGPSWLEWKLWVWIDNPYAKGTIQHHLRVAVFKAFEAHGIQMPFPQQEIYIRQVPEHSDS